MSDFDDVLECGDCGKVFSSEKALKKHAGMMHGTEDVEVLDARRGEGLVASLKKKFFGSGEEG
ncbi:MAG: C2H2-type zinc finger protein [Candidatus Nanohalobium sp.]